MATELRYTEEARQWFMEGTKTIMVSSWNSTIDYSGAAQRPLLPLLALVACCPRCKICADQSRSQCVRMLRPGLTASSGALLPLDSTISCGPLFTLAVCVHVSASDPIIASEASGHAPVRSQWLVSVIMCMYVTGSNWVQGAQSHAIWHAWAGMEASQGDATVVRYLYRRGLQANPRSRFTYLSWALFEKQQGSLENARALLKQGHQLNPRDPAILQVHVRPL